MPGRSLLCQHGPFHLLKLACRQGGGNVFLVPHGSYNKHCWAAELLCSNAQACSWGCMISIKMVLLKITKDQEREHKNTRYFHIWVVWQVREREWSKVKKTTSQNARGIWIGDFWGWGGGIWKVLVVISWRLFLRADSTKMGDSKSHCICPW